MSKKSILSTLLISSALLGAVSANAATSAVKPESKLVTVSKDGAKIYKNSKLQESKKAKKGTVYKVDGYRDINGKHYYRVFQQDSKNKTVYRGYLLNKDTKELKAQKVDKKDRFVALTKDDQVAWKNLYFNKKIKTYDGTKHSSNFEVKRTYEINGKKYFSLYRNNQWMGYMDGSAFKVLTPEKVDEEKQNYEVVKEYDTYNDLFFTKKGTITKGEEVTVKWIYTFGTGRKYGSVYNKDGQWIGYTNMNALKDVYSDVTSVDVEMLQNTIQDAKEIVNDNLVLNGTKPVEVALEAGEKVLEAAKNGKSSRQEIAQAIQKIEKAIKGVTVNKPYLTEGVSNIKKLATTVYLTKAQEEELTKVLSNVEKIDTKFSVENIQVFTDAQNTLSKAKDQLENQPNTEDGQALATALKKYNEFDKVKDYLTGFENVKSAQEKAAKVMAELKKDTPQENTATVELTGDQVRQATEELNDAMNKLEINRSNLQKYDQAAKDAIAELDKEHKDAAENLLFGFEAVAKDASIKNLNQMVTMAKELNEEIHKDQVEEINAVIEKAQRIEGVSSEETQGETAPNAKFYETNSYNAMNTALEEAQDAAKKLEGETAPLRSKRSLVEVGATQVANGKAAAEKEKDLKEKINALQVKDWQTQEANGQLQLVKYTGDYTKSTDESKQTKDDSIVIEVPGSLKDEQVVLKNGNDTNQKIFPESTNTTVNVEIRFEENSGQKVKTNGNMDAMMKNNKAIKTVDFTGLDTSNVTTFDGLFINDYFLNNVKGTEHLVTSKATDLGTMFCNTNVSTLNTSGWDTSNVTNMDRLFNNCNISTITGLKDWNVENVTNFNNMFGGTPNLTTLDLSGWSMEKATSDNTKNMFISKNHSKKTGLKDITLPNEFNGTTGQGPKLIVEALKEAGTNSQLTNTVTVKNSKGTKLGTVNTSGEWSAILTSSHVK